MSTNFRITNEEEFKRRLAARKEAARKRAEDALQKAGLHLENAIKKKLTGQRHGRVYPRGKGTPHTASAPGEPPAVDTGQLRSSITNSGVEKRLKGGMAIRVGTNQEKARDLEYGNRRRRLAPRPFMGVTFREELNKLKQIIYEAMGR